MTRKQCLQVILLFTIIDLLKVLNVIEGGSDTSRATLNIFAAAMAKHPDFVTRVRKELDAVCGDAGRLPTFADQERLPLITACVKEALRWQPFVESGLSSSACVADSRSR
jgi:cytochrome P450